MQSNRTPTQLMGMMSSVLEILPKNLQEIFYTNFESDARTVTAKVFNSGNFPIKESEETMGVFQAGFLLGYIKALSLNGKN